MRGRTVDPGAGAALAAGGNGAPAPQESGTGLWGWGQYLVAFTALLAGWHLLAITLDLPALPGPGDTLAALTSPLAAALGGHLAASTVRVAASLVWALAVAVPLGLLLGRHRSMDRFVSPAVFLIYPVPKIVFLPVVLALFGTGDISKVFLVGLIVFFQILVTTRDSARSLPPQVILSVVSLGAGERDLLRHVVFPAVLPRVFTSLRIAIGTAIAVLFIAETYATRQGLGYYIIDTWSRAAYDQMYLGIGAMGLLGLGLYLLMGLLERKFCPWEHL